MILLRVEKKKKKKVFKRQDPLCVIFVRYNELTMGEIYLGSV